MFQKKILLNTKNVLNACSAEGLSIGCAESCTGGLLSAVLTSVPGSSQVFDRAFITYTNQSKHMMLGVPLKLIDTKGAVSEEVAKMMVTGLLKRTTVDLCVAITGIAGPGGATVEKPVGCVYIAAARRNSAHICERYVFDGDRDQVRMYSVSHAIKMLESLI